MARPHQPTSRLSPPYGPPPPPHRRGHPHLRPLQPLARALDRPLGAQVRRRGRRFLDLVDGALHNSGSGDVSCLEISIADKDVIGHKRRIEQITLPRHLELELHIARNGHVFGSSMASLSKKCSGTTKLTCFMLDSNDKLCSAECMCDHPASWRNENICLDSLKELVFNGFMGTAGETDFLNLIIRSGNAVETVSVAFCKNAQPSKDICKVILSSVPAGCSVVFS
uniref:FBD domain-containing protein n=1 Tax=Arundo donax TaxID=35708 RepID=A0A0A9BRY8_ARUDO